MMPTKPARRRTERRRKPRADARLSMRVEGAHEGRSAQVVTESQNISASGVYCTSSHFMAPLSKVALTIVLPRLPGRSGAQELIKCEGIVVRCDPSARRGSKNFELACMFSDLDATRRALIEEFVTWRNLQSLREAARAPERRRRTATAARAARSSVAARGSRKVSTARTPRAAKSARKASAPARRSAGSTRG
jgi:hypothetical protein